MKEKINNFTVEHAFLMTCIFTVVMGLVVGGLFIFLDHLLFGV